MAKTIQEREQAGAGTAVTRVNSRRRFSITPYLFILPHLIFFAIFVGYPFVSGLVYSTFQYNFLTPENNTFVGLGNYANLFNPQSREFDLFWNALGNTGIFMLWSVPSLVIIPLLLAVLLNTKLPGRNIYRAIIFAPWVLSVSVISLLWYWIFQSNGGLVNSYAKALGIFGTDGPPRWLSTLPAAWVAITIATVWWTMGFNMIILLAALQDIPEQLYEAATIDGANTWQKFWRITLPLLQAVLVFVITITIIASFNLFGQPLFMTNNGPSRGTEPVMFRIYDEGFSRNAQGSAAAMSFVVALIMIVISYLNFRLFRQRDTNY
ncbi:MAG: sugar ABC transporter permease [Chloroflexi bacterium]|nr:sugar ABC transporter permease [Chloroflexota bacterium]OJV90197.1 MAG: ABC transporter permease [Chloroflexi bacterium 54-19]